MAKLNDVAEKAGVSLTTASMALSGKGRISEEVREKVQTAADELGYKRPGQNRRNPWVLLMDMAEDSDSLAYFFNPLIRQISAGAAEQGFTLSILPVGFEETSPEITEKIRSLGASAVLSIQFTRQELFEDLEQRGIPCVIINSTALQESFFTVCVDDFMGAYEGTLQLIRSGHRHIAFMDYRRDHSPGIMADRYFGFCKAMEEKGLPLPADFRKTVTLDSYGSIREAMSELLEKSEIKPTALFLHDDLLGRKVLYELDRMGISVPSDLSLIAPGDTLNYREKETARLSTMRIDTQLMGEYAVNMLQERIQKGRQAPHLIKIRQTYTDRATIVPPKS